jgi:hypothetical protein
MDGFPSIRMCGKNYDKEKKIKIKKSRRIIKDSTFVW